MSNNLWYYPEIAGQDIPASPMKYHIGPLMGHDGTLSGQVRFDWDNPKDKAFLYEIVMNQVEGADTLYDSCKLNGWVEVYLNHGPHPIRGSYDSP